MLVVVAGFVSHLRCFSPTTCQSSMSIAKKFRAIHCGSRRRQSGVKSNLDGCCVMKAEVMCSMAITGSRLSCDEERWQKVPPQSTLARCYHSSRQMSTAADGCVLQIYCSIPHAVNTSTRWRQNHRKICTVVAMERIRGRRWCAATAFLTMPLLCVMCATLLCVG